MTELLTGLPPLLASHLVVVGVALLAAVAIGLPLAIAAAPRPRLAGPLLAVAGAIQTVPGLALLALMVPLLAETGGLGLGLPAFGFAPAAIALGLYALLPIVRNAVTGLRGVDADVREAARGLGLTRGQILRQVELPLAAPVIAAGIRTAAVWTVGAATLATPVGQRCLGNYIFAGLQTRNWPMLLLGVAASAALALVLDLVLGAAERRRWAWSAGGLAAVIALVLVALPLWVGPAAGPGGAPAVVAARGGAPLVTKVVLGGKTFTEQYVLVEVLRAQLARAGVGVEVVESLGSNVVFEALERGAIDAYVEYSGTLWSNHLKRDAGPSRARVLAEVEAWLARAHGIRSLGSLGFENAYALAVTRATATRLGLRSLADLRPHAAAIAIGGDYEFFSRREWTAVRDAYQLAAARRTSFDPALLYDAVARGEVDAISAFSSDGRIAAHDLVVLADPAGALPPYDAMLLLGRRVAGDPRITCILGGLRGALSVELVRRANLMVDRDDGHKATPAAAAAWLLAEAKVPAPACD